MVIRAVSGLSLIWVWSSVIACGSAEKTDIGDDNTLSSTGATSSSGGSGGSGATASEGGSSDGSGGSTTVTTGGSGGDAGGSTGATGGVAPVGGSTAEGGTAAVECDLSAPPAGPACADTYTASNPMVDSMEGAEGHGDTDNGMPGHWWTAGDGTGSSTGSWGASGGMKYTNVVLDTPRDGSLRAMAFNGQNFTDWGAAIGIAVASCVDASAYEGIKYFIKAEGGEVTGTFNIGTYETEASPEGGCASSCDGNYKTAFTATTEWEEVTVPFCSLTPVGAAASLPIAIGKIMQIRWLLPSEEDFDIVIDDVQFY